MKKFIFYLVLFFLITSFLQAQNTNVDKIKNFCKSIDEKIGDEEDFRGYLIHTIKFVSNRPAIGIQTTTIKFYYEQQDNKLIEKNGTTEFVDIYKQPAKVVIEYNIAASQNIKIEYYPNEKGKLIYYHYLTKGAYTNGEEFYYFENEKPIKIKSTELSSDYEVLEKYKNFDREKDFTKDDLKKCEKIIKNWEDYKKMFEQMIYIEKVDK